MSEKKRGRPKIYTNAQALQISTAQKFNKRVKVFDVKCPKCGTIHKYHADVKYKYCPVCKNEVENTFNTDLYAFCV